MVRVLVALGFLVLVMPAAQADERDDKVLVIEENPKDFNGKSQLSLEKFKEKYVGKRIEFPGKLSPVTFRGKGGNREYVFNHQTQYTEDGKDKVTSFKFLVTFKKDPFKGFTRDDFMKEVKQGKPYLIRARVEIGVQTALKVSGAEFVPVKKASG